MYFFGLLEERADGLFQKITRILKEKKRRKETALYSSDPTLMYRVVPWGPRPRANLYYRADMDNRA